MVICKPVIEMVSESSHTEYILSVGVTDTVSLDSPFSDRDCVIGSICMSASVYDPLTMVIRVQRLLRCNEAARTVLQGISRHPHPLVSHPDDDTISGSA